MKASMIFYYSWKDAIKDLPDSVRLEVYEAAISFAMTGEDPALSSTAMLAFSFIKQDIIRDKEKYSRICERNRINGKNGGAPKGNTNAAKNNPNNPAGAKTTQNNPNDNDNDDDNDINNNSLYIYPSLAEESGELTLAEREIFLSIFFFKGFNKPDREVEEFVNHYEARKWFPNGSDRPVDTPRGRAALARNWSPKSGDGRFPKCADCLSWLKIGYSKAVEKYGIEKAGVILRDIADVQATSKLGEFIVKTTQEVYNMIASVDNPFVPGLVSGISWKKSYKQLKQEERQNDK